MVMYIKALLALLVVFHMASAQRPLAYAESRELVGALEGAYCASKADYSPANEVAGRLCLGGASVPFCSAGYQECVCPPGPPGTRCAVCCRTADGACVASSVLGLLDPYAQPWLRQSNAEGCLERQTASYGPLCAPIEDGKICDLLLKPVTSVELPYICLARACVKPRCSLLASSSANLVDCGCRDAYAAFPLCCQQLGNVSCLPFQQWLRQAPDAYARSISAGQAVPPANQAPGPGSGTIQLWNPCNKLNSEGSRCGPKQVCRNFRCVHACGDNGVGECVCPPGARDECKLCCVQNGVCASSEAIAGLPPNYFRPQGTPCNFTFGTCDSFGSCSKLDFHPAGNYCRERGMVECLCQPGSNAECQVCCVTPDSQCRAMGPDPVTGRLPTRPLGSPCNFTFGTCSSAGACVAVSRHPSDGVCKAAAMAGQQCGERSVCQAGLCRHICGRAELECECEAGQRSECHVCCLSPDRTTCASVYDKRPEPFLLRPVGAACNFTFGACTSLGTCQRITGSHPNDAFCQRPNNEAKSCADLRVCRRGSCLHVCSETGRLCRCPGGGPSECHKCCVNGLGRCVSIYDGSNPTLVQEMGTPCNFSFGTCDAEGRCLALASHPGIQFCSKIENEARECGELRECRDGACEHVCRATGRLCKCSPASAQECHVCCLNPAGQCLSVYDSTRPRLLQPVGTPCNYTFGTCDAAGTCRPIRRHPSTQFCELAENAGRQCGVERLCVGFECRHVCGSAERRCVCGPESSVECQLCCTEPDSGQCRSVYDGASSFLLRPPGTGCNFTFGLCDTAGACTAVQRHPGLSRCQVEGSDGAECGPARQCFRGECRHVCGSPELACRCAPSQRGECNQCCLKDGECTSLYDGQSRDLIQPLGTPCNFTYGVCDATGRCQPLKDHPASATCQFYENQGNQCGPRHRCRDFQCLHVCGSGALECRCGAGSEDECQVCCVKGGECRSAYDGRSAFLLHPQGSSCNLTAGTCDSSGSCQLRSTFCRRPENVGRQCGPRHFCKGGACAHVCGDEAEQCVCEGPDECHVCCLEAPSAGVPEANRTCASVLSPERPFLVRNLGTSCNFTRGVCVKGGLCDHVANHPFYDDKGSAARNVVILALVMLCSVVLLLC